MMMMITVTKMMEMNMKMTMRITMKETMKVTMMMVMKMTMIMMKMTNNNDYDDETVIKMTVTMMIYSIW
jgi:hypothetical protein